MLITFLYNLNIMENKIKGLSTKEVEIRISKNQVNKQCGKLTKSYKEIFINNTFTAFNLFNIVILIALLSVRAYSNTLFMGVVISNWVIGVYQEIKAKRILEKLSILNQSKVDVLRDDVFISISTQDIVIDEVVRLVSGQQVPSDMVVLSGKAELNESLLTGESENVTKEKDSELLSGSFVVSGEIIAKVIKVGADNYVNKITAEVKTLKSTDSLLIKQLNQIVKFTSYFIVPFGILLILSGHFIQHLPFEKIVPAASAALLGIMPKGIVLLTTFSLFVGVIKLANKKTLAQELSSIETLARVDVICLDKTGTITTGNMKVIDVITSDSEALAAAMGSILQYNIDRDATIIAIREYFKANTNIAGEMLEPFSSQRKYSSVSLNGKGTYYLGAVDILFKDSDPFNIKDVVSNKRYLAVAYCKKEQYIGLAENLIPLGLLVLEDQLRENAKEIIEYFNREGVATKIISGDNAKTVSMIAKQAGISNYDNYVDLSKVDNATLPEIAEKYTIFGRSTPWQKQELVKALQANNHTVAMTGDGVNDILALKQANCSITVVSGSDAARQVSQLILMDNDFASLPVTINEGRRVVNNITLTASLFLVKTIFSFLITLLSLVGSINYPYVPLHLTIAGLFAEGIPSFFLTLEANKKRIEGNFFYTIMANALPSGLLIVVFYIAIQFILGPSLHISHHEQTTLIIMMTGFVWLIQLFSICRPFTLKNLILFISMEVGFFATLFFFRDFLKLSTLSFNGIVVFLIIAVVTYPLQMLLEKLFKNVFDHFINR